MEKGYFRVYGLPENVRRACAPRERAVGLGGCCRGWVGSGSGQWVTAPRARCERVWGREGGLRSSKRMLRAGCGCRMTGRGTDRPANERGAGSMLRGRCEAIDHDFENHPPLFVPPTGEERERVRRTLEREAVRHQGLDPNLALSEQAERFGVRVRIPERPLDVDLAQRSGREREHHVPAAHPDEHDFAARNCGLLGMIGDICQKNWSCKSGVYVRAYVNGHLDARLSTGALKDNVEAISLLEDGERCLCVRFRAREGLIGVCGWRQHREAVRCVRVALGRGEREALCVDVDRAHAACTERPGECSRKESDRANTEHEHALTLTQARAARSVEEDRERLGERSLVERALGRERVEHVRGVVNEFLEGAIQVREGLGRRAEAEALAEVVTATTAVVAVVAHHASLDCDALADDAVAHARADGGDDPRRLVTEHEWRLERKVAIATVGVIVDCEFTKLA
jgi:hypothetical protein